MTVYDTLIAVSADNPASGSVGGFKEGGLAFRFCRQCMIKAEDIKSIVSWLVLIFAIICEKRMA